MVESSGAAAPPGPEGPLAWECTRASLRYIRDTVQISRGDGDLLDPLIVTAVLDANMAPVNRDPQLQVAYGGEVSAPDDLRRPVSINAVAQSLCLPFETVRRRINGLAERGVCVVEPRGVIVPYAAVMSPAYVAVQRARYGRARQFYHALRTLGVLPAPLPGDRPAGERPPTATPLIRAADRALSVYMLRVSNDLIALTQDALSSLILIELALGNIADIPAIGLSRWAVDPRAHAQPVRIASLSQGLRLSPETTRRHAQRLEAAGFCQRQGRGFVALAPPDARAELARLLTANLANIQRLFTALRQLDVLTAWDTPDPAWPAVAHR